jgi:anti-anti-sigma regulatory factor
VAQAESLYANGLDVGGCCAEDRAAVHPGLKLMARTKYYVDDEETAFSLVEEQRFYRLRVERSAIEERHVEEFLDRTVEWLSKNPSKGILIDFKGVRSVCTEFALHLSAYYQDVRDQGLEVRFVNVDPDIEPHVSRANFSVVLDVNSDKPVLSARELLEDFSNNLSDEELMKKHGLSSQGLASLFRKMLRKGLVSRQSLATRMGVETGEITINLNGKATKVKVHATQVLKDLGDDASNEDLMNKYKLSPKGLRSLFTKLYRKGLVSKAVLDRTKTVVK